MKERNYWSSYSIVNWVYEKQKIVRSLQYACVDNEHNKTDPQMTKWAVVSAMKRVGWSFIVQSKYSSVSDWLKCRG